MSNISPYLAGIFIYPIKSLDGFAYDQSTLLQSGALEHDREFALFDERGFVNGKRNAQVHLLRTWLDVDSRILSLQIQNEGQKFIFHIDQERADLEAWLSNYFGFSVKFVQNSITGFPDDTDASGPTIISTATLEVVASWFPDLSVDELRVRLRTNLEIGGVPAFWEEQLFAEANFYVQFQVGEVLFEGINPCQRCIVPTRNSKTGEATESRLLGSCSMEYLYYLANASLTLRIVEFLHDTKQLPLSFMTVIHQIDGWVVRVKLNRSLSAQ